MPLWYIHCWLLSFEGQWCDCSFCFENWTGSHGVGFMLQSCIMRNYPQPKKKCSFAFFLLFFPFHSLWSSYKITILLWQVRSCYAFFPSSHVYCVEIFTITLSFIRMLQLVEGMELSLWLCTHMIDGFILLLIWGHSQWLHAVLSGALQWKTCV